MKKFIKIYKKNKKLVVLYNNFYFFLRVYLNNHVENKCISLICLTYIQVMEILQNFGLLENIKFSEYFK